MYVLIQPVGRKEFEERTFPHEFSYIVYQKDGQYYAKNGLTGVIEYIDSDASNVINYAIGNLQNGGIVLIREGTYIITRPIDLSLKKNVTLMGISEQYGHVPSFSGTVLKLGASIDSMIKIDNSSWGTDQGGAQNNPANVVIKNLLLYGNREANYTAHGIFMNIAGGVVIDGVGIFNFAGAGIYATKSKVDLIKNCSIGGAKTSTSHNTSEIGSVWFPNDYGIYLDGVGAHFIIDKCVIAHNINDGIYITNKSSHVEDVWIHETGIYWNDGSGINIDRQTTNTLWLIHVLDNIIDENINHGIIISNNHNSNWGLGLYVNNTQIVGNGRGLDKYGIYFTSLYNYIIAGVYLVNLNIFDTLYNKQRSIKIDHVDGIHIVGGGYSPMPEIINSVNVNIGNIGIPNPIGGLPVYESLPATSLKGATVIYYDGTNYKICSYLDGWKCAVLS